MPVIAPAQVDTDGVALTLTAAAASQQFATGDNVYLEIRNGSGAGITCKINDPNTVAPPGATAFDPDATISVAAGATVIAGPFTRQRFGADGTGLADITWSSTTTVTFSPIRL